MRRAALSIGALVLALGLGLGGASVAALGAEEVDRYGEPIDARAVDDTPLVRAQLVEGQRAFFEVCAEDRFEGDWDSAAFEVWHLGDDALAQRVEPEGWRPRVLAAEQHACVVVVRWDSVLVSGEYGLRVAGRPSAEGRINGRLAAWRELSGRDRTAVGLVFLGGLLLLLGMAFQPPARTGFEALADETLAAPEAAEAKPGAWAAWRARPTWLRVSVALALLVLVVLVPVPLTGTLAALLRGLLIAVVQIALAVSFLGAGRDRAPGLGLVKPRPNWWMVLIAPVAGFLIWLAGAFLSRLVPSTGLSPVEAFVAHPSGSLALAVVAVIVPIAEELFFRGFVFGELLEKHGAVIATVVTVIVFALVHLPQQWGAWGPFLSVMLTGLVLTLLRAATKSTFVAAAAHLTYNGLITLLSLA